MKPKSKRVTEAEFAAFLKVYPRKLEADVYAIPEPPWVQYNDFTLGNWPESIVAEKCTDGTAFFVLAETTPLAG
jgi:hypothetical protein